MFERYEIDSSFLEAPHEYCPRRIYSMTGHDAQIRLNFDQLRKERFDRMKKAMDEFDIDALVLFYGPNIRYALSLHQGLWKEGNMIRYSVVPRDGDPVHFETAGSDLEVAKLDAPWMAGRIRPAITWKWTEGATEHMAKRMAESVYEVLKENKIEKGMIGIDMTDQYSYEAFKNLGIKLVNPWPAITAARLIKTPQEIECLKIATAIGDACLHKIKHEWLEPGVRESEIFAKAAAYLVERGFEYPGEIIVASGGNSSPYRRWHTDRIMRNGDLVIIDLGGIGPGGYFIDYVRCYKIGGKWTKKEKELYREVYESMYGAIEQCRPGNTTKDVANKFKKFDDDKYRTTSLEQFGHSTGITLYEGLWISRAYSMDYPAEIKENMYLAVETYAGISTIRHGVPQGVRLEENFLVTKDGPVIFTLAEHEEECIEGLREYRVIHA